MILESDDHYLYLQLPFDLRDDARAIPGHKWLPLQRRWRFPKTTQSFVALRNRFSWLRVDGPTALWLQAQAQPPNVQMDGFTHDRLYPFQQYGVRFLQTVRRAMLADAMGSGKTPQALVAAETLGARRVLVLCPKSLIWNWESEARRWTSLPVHIVEGSRMRRAEILAQKAPGLTITNYETAKLVDLRDSWDVIIADESHRLRNRRTQLAQAVTRLQAPYIWLLTGTPIHNRPDDLWCPLNWIRPEDFPSYWAFFEAFVEYYDGPYGREVIGGRNIDTLWRLLLPFTLRRPKPPLPDKIVQVVPVKLDAAQKKLYRQIEHETLLEIAGREDPLVIWGSLARLTRLKQAALAPEVLGATCGSAKLEACLDIVEDAAKDQFVIYTGYTEVLKLLRDRLEPHAELYGEMPPAQRQEEVERFRSGQVRILVATLGTGGEGINLTPAHRAIFLDHPWNPAVVEQAEDRIHRIGQGEPCHYIHLVARDTVDETIMAVLRSKAELAGRILSPLEVLRRHFATRGST